MIEGLIFDFDGLILDTESPKFQAWEEIFQSYGSYLPISVWNVCLGTSSEVFDPIKFLEQQLNVYVNRQQITEMCRERESELLRSKTALPGVVEHINRAKEIGLKLAVASSSSHKWVTGHLKRLNLLDKFDTIITREKVDQVKPDPQLFITACQAIHLSTNQVMVYEDSLNGLLAARAAGIFCIVIPNEISTCSDLNQADMILQSLADIPLDQLLFKVNNIKLSLINNVEN